MQPSSLPLRMLLNTDGTVTTLLEACFRAPVAVETLSNAVDDRRPRSLRRTAVLRVARTGRPLLRASTVLAIDRLPQAARTALLDGAVPIGTILRDAQLETRRELLSCAEHAATAQDAAELGIDEGAPVFERSYRIVTSSQQLAVVTERVSASLFDAAAA